MKAAFVGAKQAGIIGLLTVLSQDIEVKALVYHDEALGKLAHLLKIPSFQTVEDKEFLKFLKSCDLLVNVHGREIISKKTLSIPKRGGINVHPCLSQYRGADPIGRLLSEKNSKASVGVHFMTEKVDEGEVICEHFIDVGDCKTRDEVYNKLYPLYTEVIIESLRQLRRDK